MLLYQVKFTPWDWTIAVTCRVDGTQRGLPLENIVDRMHPGTPAEQQYAFLFDQSATFHFAPETRQMMHPEQLQAMQSLAHLLQAQQTGTAALSWQEPDQGVVHQDLLFFQQVAGLNLTVGLVVPRNRLYAPYSAFRRRFFLIFSAALLTGLVLTFFLSHPISAPLKRLALMLGPGGKALRHPAFPAQEAKLKSIIDGTNRLLAERQEHQRMIVQQEEGAALIQQQFRQEVANRKEMQLKLLAEINTRKSAEIYLQLFKNLFDNAIEGIFITDAKARILTVNQSFCEITGYQPSEVIGQNPRILSSGRHHPEFYQQMRRSLKTRGAWSGEIWNRKKDGTIWPQWLSISQSNNDKNETTHYFAFFHDISELKRKEKQISIMAYSDALTKLPNRAALEMRLAKAISRADRENLNLAIFFIDLDNFKNINDSLGHDKGDQVLIEVAERLGNTIRTEDTLSRLGGDEFILLSENVENESAVYNLGNRLLASLNQPVTLGPSTIYINASIGISLYPHDGRTIQELIKNADMAMYKAKSEGKNKFVMYTHDMNERLQIRIKTEAAIRTGLKQQEFVVYYQPKIDLVSEKATSFEALLRWRRDGTIIGPDDFIPVAEETGLIDEMSLYVLNAVCLFLGGLQRSGLPVLPVSVNMSPRTFNNINIVEVIDSILESHKIDHKFIEFEITETTAMHDVRHTLATMQRFRQRGINFSIDDFGTGYSSLSCLNEMPVSTLKIDKRFINTNEVNNRSIVSIITAMSQQMQLKVIAEGVETLQQAQWLKSIGCNEVQGFYFCRPMPEQDTIRYLHARNHNPVPLQS